MNNKDLLKLAEEVRKNAYVPYSEFKVGAALLTKSGKVYTGCNVECASIGATNCAEGTAIFKAISEGDREFEAIAIASSNSEKNEPTYPCGICRQVIAEFVIDEKIPVIIIKNKNDYIVKTFEEILPGVFSKKDLKG